MAASVALGPIGALAALCAEEGGPEALIAEGGAILPFVVGALRAASAAPSCGPSRRCWG